MTGDHPAILPSFIVTGAPLSEGQPTAPRRITSAAAHRSSAPSGQSREPCFRKYCPPHGISSTSNVVPDIAPAARSTRSPCSITSGPVPSPGSATTCTVIGLLPAGKLARATFQRPLLAHKWGKLQVPFGLLWV